MAELDEIVQKILLEGDEELLSSLEKIGRDGAEHIKQLYEACESGASPMQAFAGSLAIIAAAVSTAAVSILHFVEAQDELVQKTAFLAEAFGATTGQLQGIEAAFAQAGVSAQTFEQFANRLTISIAREWPLITDNIRTAATAQDEAQGRIITSTVRLKEANNALANSSGDLASKSAANNLRVEQAYNRLKFAAQEAAAQMTHDMENVAGATLGLESAQQRLATLQGHPPSEAEKQGLAIREAQLAVDKARQAQADALRTQQEHAAEAASKRAAAEQALDDAERKRFEDRQAAELTLIKLQEARRSAADAVASAEERSTKLALTNVTSITAALTGIIDKNKEAARAIDFTQVSVANLERGIMAAASAGGKQPSGLDVLHKLSEVLSADTEHLISKSERLALVQRLSSTSLRNSGAATSELLKVLEHGKHYIDSFSDAAEHAFSNTKEGVANVEEFKGALESFNLTLQLTQQNLAAEASPAFTEFLKELKTSLTDSDGILHTFVEGIKFIGAAVAGVIHAFQSLGQWIDHTFHLKEGTGMKLLLDALITLVSIFGGWWARIPAAILLVIEYVGTLKGSVEGIVSAAQRMWDSFKDSSIIGFFNGVVDVLKRVLQFLGLIKKEATGANISTNPGAAKTNEQGASLAKSVGDAAGATGAGGGLTVLDAGTLTKYAGGGEVDGPGTTTSDSIFARLSRGEFVVKAAAVQAYGANLFHQLNSMQFPGFADGGLVPSPVRMSGGGVVPASSTLNLSIDGRSFNGLKGPKNVVDDLTSFAIGRQTSAAGRNPSWFK